MSVFLGKQHLGKHLLFFWMKKGSSCAAARLKGEELTFSTSVDRRRPETSGDRHLGGSTRLGPTRESRDSSREELLTDFKGCGYDEEMDDCEHVSLHRCLRLFAQLCIMLCYAWEGDECPAPSTIFPSVQPKLQD